MLSNHDDDAPDRRRLWRLVGVAGFLAVPLASILVTLIDIVVRDKDPAEEPVPSVLFPAKDLE